MAESNYGTAERPTQTEEQIQLASDAAEYMHDVIDRSSAST